MNDKVDYSVVCRVGYRALLYNESDIGLNMEINKVREGLIMFFITQKTINGLAAKYKEPDMLTCYAVSQALASVTSRAILLINNSKVIILFLNALSSKVVQKVEFDIADIQNQKFKSGLLFSAIWSFDAGGKHWRFSIIKKMLTLGSMQGDFLRFLTQNVIT